MTKRNIWAVVLLIVFTLSGCGGAVVPTQTVPAEAPSATPVPTLAPNPTPAPLPSAIPDPIGDLLGTLSMEEKVGQLLVAGLEGTAAGEDARRAIRDYKVGGVILFSRNVESARQLTELTNELKAMNGGYIPLLVSVDQEGGTVNRMPPEVEKLPPAYTFGDISEEGERTQLCYDLGVTLAAQCKAFGFHVDFAPVLDVWSNPENTVIAKRAFGQEADLVAQAAPMTAYGLMDSGVIPVVKHFPGHGDTAVDSHVGLPVVEKTVEELENLELKPFREAVRKGRLSGTYDPAWAAVPAVMVGHILMNKLDPEKPASLSQAVVTGLLRERLGFEGVVFTDDMTMGAITDTYGIGEAAVLAVEAGCDQLLICHGADNLTVAREALLEAVRTGRVTEQRLDESLRRVLELKNTYALTDDPVEPPDVEALNEQIQALIARLPG